MANVCSFGQQHLLECGYGAGWGVRVPIVRWKSDNIVHVIRAKKTSQSAWADWVVVPPSCLPPPPGPANHSPVARYRRKTNISRTSLMHTLCIMNIKKVQTSTSVVGAAGRRLSRERGWMFFSFLPQREKGHEQEVVCYGFSVTSYHRTSFKAITMCSLRQELLSVR